MLERAHLVVECSRAALRATDEPGLARTLCQLLFVPELYAEVCLVLTEHDADRRSFYAGGDKDCLNDPERFWSAGSRLAVLDAALSGTTAHTPAREADTCLVVLAIEGQPIGAVALCPGADRVVDADELEQLRLLVDDIAFAFARLREDARHRALALSERRLRDTVEHAGVGITRIDAAGHFIEVNQRFCHMLGYTRDELVGRPARDVTVPEDYGPGAVFREQARRGLAVAKVHTSEKRYLHKDGSHLWARRTLSPAFDEHGKLRDAISIVEDITERKAAEEAARVERVLLRTIINALPDFVHVKDAHGRVQLGNTAWLASRGLTEAEVHGKTVFDMFPAAMAQRMDKQDRQVIATGAPVRDEEFPIVLRDHSGTAVTRWSATTKVPMRDEQGNIVGIVGFSRDITPRRRLERERAMQHAVARALSESRSVQQTMPDLIHTICGAMEWSYGAYWLWDTTSESLKRSAWWSDIEPEFDAADEVYWKELTTLYTTGLLGKAWLEQRATWVSDVAEMSGFRRAASCKKLGLRSAFAFPIVAADERVGIIEFFGRDAREADEALLEVSDAVSKQIGQFILRKEAEESLQESEQQLRAVFDQADVGMAMTALDMKYLRVNDKYCGIVGYDRAELLNMRVSEVNLEANVDAMREYRSRMLHENIAATTVEKQLVRKDGSLVWVSMATSLVRGSDGTPRHFIAVIQDISETKRAAEALKESEEQFRVLAHYDLLTGLPNRALFYDRLAHALAQARRNRWWLAVMFIDLDRFKNVNDTFGHAAGDLLLKQVSERLADCVRSDDTVGRLSGDEFAIVLSRLTAPSDASVVANKIIDSLNKPFSLEGTELFVSVSIGITVFPTDSVDQDALIRNADVAMYRAKDRGRNNFQFYTPEMNRRTREMLNMESELRRAVERDELVLHYQPKVSLKTGQITGVEALLRWQHPERGLVPPGDFIPLLEETGLVVQAGEWVLRAVCRQLNEWRSAGVQVVPVAVNLSARQFLSRDLGAKIKAILAESGVEAGLLEVEITESAIMNDIGEANRTLEYLQSIGVKSAIDDFGTGYSSLGYLKRFPLKALKVDRSFVSEITTDADDANITQAVISMAHSLGLIVIAEGVETEAQLAYLLRYGCDEVQGYLFSRPLPAPGCAAAIADPGRAAILIDAVRKRAE
jgi:diguanylate cyclase (GGDEF)-like protein/PAS domain S-box-containing protein